MLHDIGFAVDVLHDVYVSMAEEGALGDDSMRLIPAPAPTALILAHPKAGALTSDGMECKHLLPHTQCSLCLDLIEDLVEPEFEKHDYVEVIAEREIQPYPQDEVRVGEVHPRVIYGTQTALRISKTLGKGSS